jgi:hypothetical protein
MPKAPKSQKHPADVVGNAVRVTEIATGQGDEEYDEESGKQGLDCLSLAFSRSRMVCRQISDGRGKP